MSSILWDLFCYLLFAIICLQIRSTSLLKAFNVKWASFPALWRNLSVSFDTFNKSSYFLEQSLDLNNSDEPLCSRNYHIQEVNHLHLHPHKYNKHLQTKYTLCYQHYSVISWPVSSLFLQFCQCVLSNKYSDLELYTKDKDS